jgi:hypothetical protein
MLEWPFHRTKILAHLRGNDCPDENENDTCAVHLVEDGHAVSERPEPRLSQRLDTLARQLKAYFCEPACLYFSCGMVTNFYMATITSAATQGMVDWISSFETLLE